MLVDPVEQAEQAPLGVVDRHPGGRQRRRRVLVEGLPQPVTVTPSLAFRTARSRRLAAIAAEAEAGRALGGGGVGPSWMSRLEVAELVQPMPDVAAAVAARDAGVAADREHDRATRTPELGGDLQPARPERRRRARRRPEGPWGCGSRWRAAARARVGPRRPQPVCEARPSRRSRSRRSMPATRRRSSRRGSGGPAA